MTYKICLKYVLFCVLLWNSTVSVSAQGWLSKDLTRVGDINVKELSESQKKEVMSAIQAQGLNPSDLESLLKAQGLNAPNALEKDNNLSKKIAQKDTLPKKQINENILQSSVAIFGQDLFLSQTEPLINNNLIAPSKNYQLGIGDQMVVRVYGLQEQSTRTTINKNGDIFLPRAGRIKASGLTIKEAQNQIKRKLISKGFRSLASGQSQINISVEKFHSVHVVVWGAQQSGAYTLPAMSTVFDALYAAQGPQTNRSFRNIQVIRENTIVDTLDLYDLLTQGVSENNVILNNGDIIFIPYHGPRVRLRGEVKTPAIFELKNQESLSDLLRYSGGFTEIAYTGSISIMRYGKEEKEYFSLSNNQTDTFELKGGEVIDVASINNTEKYRVEVIGGVKRPGYYAAKQGNHLKNIIQQAGGLESGVVKSNVLIRRDQKKDRFLYQRYSLDKVMRDELLVNLGDGDVVYIADSADLLYNDFVQILGEVQNPGTFAFGKNLTVGDVLVMAGGFSKDANTTTITISRKVKDEITLSTLTEIKVRADYWNQQELFKLYLQPGDLITTYRDPLISDLQLSVSIEGEVIRPGTYVINSREQTLWDAFSQSQGLNRWGDFNNAVLLRRSTENITDAVKRKKKKSLINELYVDSKTDLKDLLTSNEYDTISLFNPNIKINIKELLKSIKVSPGDRLIIPKTIEKIRVSGAVLAPNTFFYLSELSFKDAVNMGGGYADQADIKNAFVLYSNGTSQRVKRILGVFKKYPKLRPGCEVVIPMSNKKNNENQLTLTERLSIYSIISTSISSLALIIVNLGM